MKRENRRAAQIPSKTRLAAPRPKKRASTRRKQQRSIDTRLNILEAALAEFAEKGYSGASTRNIAERAGLQHPLITYHFRTKETLWRAVAEHFHKQIRSLWDQQTKKNERGISAIDQVREEFHTLLRFSVEHPRFHQFMLNENRLDSPRLAWLMKTMLAQNIGRVLPQIRAAQKAGDLPPAEPVLIHYMLIGMTTVLSSLAPEIRRFSGISPDDPHIVEAYWKLIESLIFAGAFKRRSSKDIDG